jgi:histidine phosphotransferase ChpT
MAMTIARRLADQIRAHAASDPAHEVCGLLFGDEQAITAVTPTANVHPDPARHFEVDPAVLIAALRAERGGGQRLIGHYHSHPSGDVMPSARDAASAEAGRCWLIVAGGQMALFRAGPAGSFTPVALDIVRDQRVASGGASRQKGVPFKDMRPNMTTSPVDFASLLCSRLCHDLLSPVGALNNGLELLADEHDPEMRARCLDLLGESARASANKLKFFRLAFGAAGGFGDVVDTREARAAIEGLFGADGRTQIGWLVAEPTLDKTAIKVLLNLALIAGDALVRGGQLDIGAESTATGTEIVIRAEGPRLVLDPELRTALQGETDEAALTPRAAAAWLVHSLARDSGGSVQVSDPADAFLVFGATLGRRARAG